MKLTSQEIQVLAEGLNSVLWAKENIVHAKSSAKKLFHQAEAFDPALREHLFETCPRLAALAGKSKTG